MKSCAIIQMEAVHEDFIPAVIYLLNLNGYKPTVHLPSRSINNKGNAFDMAQKLTYNLDVHDLDGRQDLKDLQQRIKKTSEYEFVLVNTFQQKKLIKWFLELNKPLIGIVHNVAMFKNSEQYEAALNKEDLYFMTLSYHVAIKLRNVIGIEKINVSHFIPFYLADRGQDSLALLSQNQKIRIGIIGGIQFKSRNLKGLVNKLKQVKDKRLSDRIQFVICGGGKDRKEFSKLVEDSGLTDFFDFAPTNEESGFVEYEDYRESVLKSDFLISLFPANTHRYLVIKISSIIYNSLGYGIPIFMDRSAEMIYDIPCVHYDISDLENELIKLTSMTAKDYFGLKKELYNYRMHVIEQGTRNMKIAIDSVLA